MKPIPTIGMVWISVSLSACTPSSERGAVSAEPGSRSHEQARGVCPPAWLAAPAVDPSIAVPDGGGAVMFHASARGTQNYRCASGPGDAGAGYGWTPIGPEATLSDCNAAVVGTHEASDGGAAAPEWRTTDGSSVIATKAASFSPPSSADRGAPSVPWLLLKAVSNGGAGPLAHTRYIERVDTSGGTAPSAAPSGASGAQNGPNAAPCDASHEGSVVKSPYTASYYFFGP